MQSVPRKCLVRPVTRSRHKLAWSTCTQHVIEKRAKERRKLYK